MKLDEHTPERLAYSIAELAKMIGCSRSWIYMEIKAGQGPRLTRLGRRVVVTVDDAKEWLGRYRE